ncbi:MAG: L-serine ammonia-lyase, iron-sulfur-dependent, subunit alpha, partial [Eggerthellaceae bacterium]|nr:L-serine ammonia-lyase, iron-sulfur-dependent, subunit alpha [Eggerthellaceae bacterium]
MKTLTIRDIIGPVMIGPSSSHTAGALRIALMARKLLTAKPADVTFTLYGSFAHTYRGHGTDRALVAGMLGFLPDDERIRDSFALAEAAGLTFRFVPDESTQTAHPNTVDISVVDAEGESMHVRGESIGGGAAVIRELNGVEVLLSGEYHSIVVKQRDECGVLAHIATCLNVFGINIATTRLFRERKGDIAYTIMETDDEIPERIVQAIEANRSIYSVTIIKSDRSSEAHAPRTPGEEPSGFGSDLSAEEALALFERLDFANGRDMLAYCEENNLPLSDAICRRERCYLASCGEAVDDTNRYLFEALEVMRASVHEPLNNPKPSMGGLIGGEAAKLAAYENAEGAAGTGSMNTGGPASAPADDPADDPAGDPAGARRSLCDPLLARATTYAMAVLETNASMGRIVAAPTAGSSGVVPAMLFACQDIHGFTDYQLQRALANAAAIGYLIARNATVSGAEGGCQAEVGAASAMAASAAAELMGGTPRQCFAAAANALAGIMGLVCDPIAGLVEAPCQKRNATGVANALVSAQMALAGIENLVDFDETVAAMYAVGRSLPFELRESALGGMAATPSAR